MDNKLSITINGKKLLVNKNKTILNICKDEGIFIPTFCHDDRFESEGSCRMCIVEVNGNKDKLETSCTLFPRDGMVINTETDEVNETRQEMLKLLWATHPNDCVVCEKNGRCSLQDYMYLYDIPSEKEFDLPVRDFKKDTSNKFFDIDPNKCILCNKCINVCTELVGVNALSKKQRGKDSFISFTYEVGILESPCVSCGNCVSVCPTAALTEKPKIKYKESEVKKFQTTCAYCGVGCQMDLVVKDNTVVRVDPVNAIPNEGLLCVKGKFAFNYINHPDRLKTPLIKRNGVFEEASWEEAYSLITNKIKETKDKYGPDVFAGLTSAKCTNEENYLFQKFIRAVIGTNNVDHCARLCHASTVTGLASTLGSGAMTNSIAEVKNNDVIFVIGSNTTETHPVIGNFMHQAIKRGAKLIVAEPREIDLAKKADVFIQIRPGTNIALINGMMNVIYNENLHDKTFIKTRTEGFDEIVNTINNYPPERSAKICGCKKEDIISAARIYAKGKHSAIYYAMGVTQHSNGTNHVRAMANLAMMCGMVGKEATGVNPLRGQNNVQGACDVGGLPDVYPGYQKVFKKEIKEKFEKAWNVPLSDKVGLSVPHIINAAYDGSIKFLYVMGENPVVSDPDITHVKESLRRLDFLVVQDIFMSETAEFADVILPASSFAEKEGTFTNTERRIQMVRQAINPIGNSKPDWVIITELMRLLGYDQKTNSPKEIMDELASVSKIYKGISYDRIKNIGLQWPVRDKNHPGTKYLHKDRFSRGLGLFYKTEHLEPKELPDEEYPLTLTTGRVLYHFHTRTMTKRNESINELVPTNYIEINQFTADLYNLSDMQVVIVKSRRGKTSANVHITEKMANMVVFMPFHFANGANMITNTELDPNSDIPELKVASCQIVVS